MGNIAGHYWTFRPYIGHVLRPVDPPASRCFRAMVQDETHGPVPLTGRLSDAPGDELCVIVHGLGGSSGSYYAIRAAREARAAGLASLRLNLRGADRSGADFYHAGLAEDLRAALSSPRLARYRSIYLFGFSLGGHLVLRYLAEGADPRVRAAATVCAPLDLAAGAFEIDRPQRYVYRQHLLRGLKEMYTAVATRRETVVPLEEALRIDTIRAWDERIVAPRFGFRDAEDYWARATVMPMLDAISVPTLAVVASHDPMVLAHTVRPALTRAKNLEVVYVDEAGHVGFPEAIDLGLRGRIATRGPVSVEHQVISWLRSEIPLPPSNGLLIADAD
jgi:uncharacterized protein